MLKVSVTHQALELSEPERFELAHRLWASLEDPNAYRGPLPEWQRKVLDERLKASANEEGETWEQVKADIWPETR